MNPAELPGSHSPERRLAITPVTLRLPSVRLPRRFPYSAPTRPGGVELAPRRSRLGADFRTDWARRYPARLARVVVEELCMRPLVEVVAHPRIEGVDRFEHVEAPVIFAVNHTSHLDTPIVLACLPERFRHKTVVAAAADYFFDTWVKGVAFSLAVNAISIERQKVSRRSTERASALLNEGWSLLIFPEGGRSTDGWGQTHSAGAAWLAVRTGRPVVPVHVQGTREMLPRGARRLRRGDARVSFGRPLQPRGGEDARAMAVEIEGRVAALADEGASGWWEAARHAAQGATPPLTGPTASAWRRSWALGVKTSPGKRSVPDWS